MSSTTHPVELPSIPEVEAVDEKFASVRSDLDMLVGEVERFNGEDVPLQEIAQLVRDGGPIPRRPRHTDPATIARLLAFANELAEEADAIAEYARALRDGVTQAYRQEVLERNYVPPKKAQNDG